METEATSARALRRFSPSPGGRRSAALRRPTRRLTSRPQLVAPAAGSDLAGSPGCRADADAASIWSLPQPRHLFAAAAGSAHFHMGHFVASTESLATGLHRMAVSCAHPLPEHARVLDVGCGTGGTTRVLSRLGHQVVGLDPCLASLRHARAIHADLDEACFVRGRYDAWSRDAEWRHALPGPLDAVVFLEVLHHFDDLDAALRRARHLLRRRALVIVADLFTRPALPRDHVPYHRDGALLEAATRERYRLVSRRSLTCRVLPTIDLLGDALERGVRGGFAPPQGVTATLCAQARELRGQLDGLRAALRNGDLVYELVVLEAK